MTTRQLYCPVCGNPIGNQVSCCPHCDSELERPTPARMRVRQHRFIWLFVLLVGLCIAAVIWLPRSI